MDDFATQIEKHNFNNNSENYSQTEKPKLIWKKTKNKKIVLFLSKIMCFHSNTQLYIWWSTHATSPSNTMLTPSIDVVRIQWKHVYTYRFSLNTLISISRWEYFSSSQNNVMNLLNALTHHNAPQNNFPLHFIFGYRLDLSTFQMISDFSAKRSSIR